MQHRQALPSGTRLHEYELLQVLGSGGFGIVYLAQDHELNQRVVIKEYLPSSCAIRAAGNTVVPARSKDEDIFQWGLERFLAEARALAEFRQHPNIVSVLRYFKANNTGYMVMEYAGAISLQDYLDQRHTLNEAQLEVMIFPLLDALAKVHEKGIIHRDLKPANILINGEGQPVLIDFGSARQAFGHKSMNMTAIVSPGYSPFEQYTETGKQGPWTDIYALAAVMYRCVTGMIPPDALERLESSTPLATSSKAVGQYSRRLLAGIDWGLQIRVTDRPASIEAWRNKLTEPAIIEPVVVLPVNDKSANTPILPAIRQHLAGDRRLWAVPLLGMALLIGMGMFISQFFQQHPPQPVAALEQSTVKNTNSVPAATVTTTLPKATAVPIVEATPPATTDETPPAKPGTATDSATELQQLVLEKQQNSLRDIVASAADLKASQAGYQQARQKLLDIDKILEKSKDEPIPAAKRKAFLTEVKQAQQRNQDTIDAYQRMFKHYRNAIGELCSYGDVSVEVMAQGMSGVNKVEAKATEVIEKHRQLLCANRPLTDKELIDDLDSLN